MYMSQNFSKAIFTNVSLEWEGIATCLDLDYMFTSLCVQPCIHKGVNIMVWVMVDLRSGHYQYIHRGQHLLVSIKFCLHNV